ncbi:MAG: DUF4435 domain-containing protein [Oscillatoria sp. SIO1A7]|nr:DUF4435 domain-containing protein [Oscillatoria sp. SIO1A7]
MTNITPDTLIKEAEDADVPSHDFKLIYQKQAKCVYGFVEGNDDRTFYEYLIRPQLPEGWTVEFIKSGRKKEVLRSLENFRWGEVSRKRICFFVDRDLQDFLKNPPKPQDNLYITDGYSIENYILQDAVLLWVLRDFHKIDLLKEQQEIIKRIIRKNEDSFFEAMMPLMAQILLWMRRGDKPTISNFLETSSNFSQFIGSFDEANFSPKDRKKLLEKAAEIMKPNKEKLCVCEDSEIAEAENEIRSRKNCRHLIHGKHALWFFVKQCEAISQAIPTLLGRSNYKYTKKPNYNRNDALIIFAPQARAPESLKDFVEQNYLSFIREQKSLDARDG